MDTPAAPDRSDAVDDCDIVSARGFDAPRDVVYRAFADPAVLAGWWGPAGFTNTFEAFDLRPGGDWRFVMHGPDGTDYAITKRFVEVVPGVRIVLDHVQPMHHFRMTIVLADDAGGGTRVTWRMRFDTPDDAGRVRAFIARANEENFDRLAAALATLTAG